MEQIERTQKDIEKLKQAIWVAKRYKLNKKVIEWAQNYLKDSLHFFEKKDYFSAFGCANYAYGLIDSLFIQKGIKEKVFEEEGV